MNVRLKLDAMPRQGRYPWLPAGSHDPWTLVIRTHSHGHKTVRNSNSQSDILHGLRTLSERHTQVLHVIRHQTG